MKDCFAMSGHAERVPVKSIAGDLTRLSDLEEAFRGVDVVFHAASVIDLRAFPDYRRLEMVNISGQ